MPLTDRRQTGEAMYHLSRRYAHDLDEFEDETGRMLSKMPFQEYYNLVRSIPYSQDRKEVEVIARPRIILTNGPGDCKKKAILMGSWFDRNKIPYRFVAVSSRPDGRIHHVITEAMSGGEWVQVDATYIGNVLGPQKWTNRQVLPSDGPETMSGAALVTLSGNATAEHAQHVEMGVDPIITAAAISGGIALIKGFFGGKQADEQRQHEREMAEYYAELERQRQGKSFDEQFSNILNTLKQNAGWLVGGIVGVSLLTEAI